MKRAPETKEVTLPTEVGFLRALSGSYAVLIAAMIGLAVWPLIAQDHPTARIASTAVLVALISFGGLWQTIDARVRQRTSLRWLLDGLVRIESDEKGKRTFVVDGNRHAAKGARVVLASYVVVTHGERPHDPVVDALSAVHLVFPECAYQLVFTRRAERAESCAREIASQLSLGKVFRCVYQAFSLRGYSPAVFATASIVVVVNVVVFMIGWIAGGVRNADVGWTIALGAFLGVHLAMMELVARALVDAADEHSHTLFAAVEQFNARVRARAKKKRARHKETSDRAAREG